MSETTAPEAPATQKRKMSEEHKAKLAAGRKAARERKAEPAKDDVLAELARLRAELEALKPSPEKIAQLPKAECYYEFVAEKRDAQGNRIGEVIRTVDDPRWESLRRYDRPISGSLIVNALTYDARGEVIDRRQTHNDQVRKADIALEKMQRFNATGDVIERTIRA